MAPAQSAALLGWLREGSAEEQRARIETYFGTIGGHVVEIDTTDGLRVTFDRGVVIPEKLVIGAAALDQRNGAGQCGAASTRAANMRAIRVPARPRSGLAAARRGP